MLQLTSGTAEIFGSALVISTVYKFRTGAKIAVFTWEGCVLNLVGKETSAAYVADETPMVNNVLLEFKFFSTSLLELHS